MTTLRDNYKAKVIPALRKEFGIANVMAVPKITKVTVNVGTGRIHKDGEAIKKIVRDLALLTGQKPVARAAKKSIASFKMRQGVTVGYSITLRGTRMWDFIQRLVGLALPVSKDFRGIDPKNVDRDGNLNLGIREHSIFPEVNLESMKDIFGLQVTVTTNARNRDRGLSLLRHVGFPIRA